MHGYGTERGPLAHTLNTWKVIQMLSKARFPLMALGLLALLTALWGGLVRLGWAWPLPWPTLFIAHGPLMVCGFLGTLIGVERAVALEATPTILPDSLPPGIRGSLPSAGGAPLEALPESGFDLEAHVKEIEMSYIAEALKRAGGVQVKAAELLGMSFRSFRYYVKKYNLR